MNKTLIPENMTVARLLTQKEVAEILGVSEKWIERDRWVERRIPFTKIGRSVRYRAADLNAYIDANTRIFD
ncbi:helix-turn-helix domain-containing protein [Paracoccus cavernae]|uniref:helix-turn-helix domain-containing protein n=1 Tax=Paracoccus cavernae TaxID=1571207 RepID=UPI0036136FB2